MYFSRIDQSKLSSVSCIYLIFVHLMSLITSFVSFFGHLNLYFPFNVLNVFESCFLTFVQISCTSNECQFLSQSHAHESCMREMLKRCRLKQATAALLRDSAHACFNNVIGGFMVHFVYFQDSVNCVYVSAAFE